MKAKSFLLLILVLVTTSCKDFFAPNTPSGVPSAPIGRDRLPEGPKGEVGACDFLPAEFSEPAQKMVWSLAVKAQCPKVVELRDQLSAVRQSALQLCGNGGLRAQRDLVYHFEGAIGALQYLLGNPFGPLRRESARLSMEIYSWPNYNRFALNQELLNAQRLGEAYRPGLAPSRKGFAAIESLVFNSEARLSPGPSGRLRPEEEIFNQLNKSERQNARCRVMTAMIEDASLQVEELFRSVHAREGRYAEWLIQRMQNGEGQMVLNEVSDGLFYLEKVKDFKLGVPLGLSPRCTQDKCPEQAEFPNSDLGTLSLRQNLEGFRTAIFGFEGEPGFNQLLENVNRGDVAEQFRVRLTKTFAILDEVEARGPLREQFADLSKSDCAPDNDSAPPVCKLYFELKALTALFKTDFLTALNLQPPRTDADND